MPTPEQLTELRRLLAEATPDARLAVHIALDNARRDFFPDLLDAADDCERYRLKTLAQDAEIAKLREALAEMIDDHEGHCTDSAENACGLVNRARAALKGGAK
jgi:hypothetical protein